MIIKHKYVIISILIMIALVGVIGLAQEDITGFAVKDKKLTDKEKKKLLEEKQSKKISVKKIIPKKVEPKKTATKTKVSKQVSKKPSKQQKVKDDLIKKEAKKKVKKVEPKKTIEKTKIPLKQKTADKKIDMLRAALFPVVGVSMTSEKEIQKKEPVKQFAETKDKCSQQGLWSPPLNANPSTNCLPQILTKEQRCCRKLCSIEKYGDPLTWKYIPERCPEKIKIEVRPMTGGRCESGYYPKDFLKRQMSLKKTVPRFFGLGSSKVCYYLKCVNNVWIEEKVECPQECTPGTTRIIPCSKYISGTAKCCKQDCTSAGIWGGEYRPLVSPC